MSSPSKSADQSNPIASFASILAPLIPLVGCEEVVKQIVSRGTERTTAVVFVILISVIILGVQSISRIHPTLLELLIKCYKLVNGTITPDELKKLNFLALLASVALAGIGAGSVFSALTNPPQFAITSARPSIISGPPNCNYKIVITWVNENENTDRYELINRPLSSYDGQILDGRDKTTGSFEISDLSCQGLNQCADEVVLTDLDGNSTNPERVSTSCYPIQSSVSASPDGP